MESLSSLYVQPFFRWRHLKIGQFLRLWTLITPKRLEIEKSFCNGFRRAHCHLRYGDSHCPSRCTIRTPEGAKKSMYDMEPLLNPQTPVKFMKLQLSVPLSHGINKKPSIYNKSSKSNDNLSRYSTLKFTHPKIFNVTTLQWDYPYKLQISCRIGKSKTENLMKKVQSRYLEPFSQRSL